MLRYTVFYESWQMECCGTPFSVGDTVKWLVREAGNLNSPVETEKMDFLYEAHSSEWNYLFVLEGRVEKIKILYRRYVSSEDNPCVSVISEEEIFETDIAEVFEKEMNNKRAVGYFVFLNECAVRPAKKEEVTFLRVPDLRRKN